MRWWPGRGFLLFVVVGDAVLGRQAQVVYGQVWDTFPPYDEGRQDEAGQSNG